MLMGSPFPSLFLLFHIKQRIYLRMKLSYKRKRALRTKDTNNPELTLSGMYPSSESPEEECYIKGCTYLKFLYMS